MNDQDADKSVMRAAAIFSAIATFVFISIIRGRAKK